ncbi:MAG: hypothetical protein II842_08480 [Butyrivibrio sp.]|nr:hypothetical protein [Butyrivibrio sp.]
MESENKDLGTALPLKLKLCYVGLFLSTGIVVFAFSYFFGKSYEAILRNTIVSLIISAVNLFMLMETYRRGWENFPYDNYEHIMRFILAYGIMILLSCAFSLVPNVFWPYMAIFVVLGLLSNNEIGMASGIGFVLISVLLEDNGSIGEFFMYVIAGMVALALFRDLKEDTAIGFPTAMVLMLQAVLIIAFDVLFQNRTLSFNLLILPVINLMLNLVILMPFLNMFGIYVIRKSNDNYMEINDSAYPLLVSLRENNKDEYFRAVHTAYLAERIALALGLNDRAVKNCCYYHRIGILEGKQKWEDVKHIYIENNFPHEAIDFLQEYIEAPANKVKSCECFAVDISETVIATITYLIKKEKDKKVNYDEVIDKIFEEKESEGQLLGYNVTFGQYAQMKKILKKEKLYYDFLR